MTFSWNKTRRNCKFSWNSSSEFYEFQNNFWSVILFTSIWHYKNIRNELGKINISQIQIHECFWWYLVLMIFVRNDMTPLMYTKVHVFLQLNRIKIYFAPQGFSGQWRCYEGQSCLMMLSKLILCPKILCIFSITRLQQTKAPLILVPTAWRMKTN